MIDTIPAKKKLPDGRNAHLTQRGHEWWLEQLDKRGFRMWQRPNPRRLEVLYHGT